MPIANTTYNPLLLNFLSKTQASLLSSVFNGKILNKLGYKDVLELKKTKHQALVIAIDKAKGFASIKNVCDCFNLKRDAYYKYNSRVKQKKTFEYKFLHIVKKRRKALPREGVRKLMKSLNNDFEKQQLKVGRDTCDINHRITKDMKVTLYFYKKLESPILN